MRRAIVLVLSLLLVGCASGPKSADSRTGRAPVPPVSIEEYFQIRRVGGSSFSHDERTVAYTSDEGGRTDIWVQPVDEGDARQVTHTRGFIHSFAFSPTADHLLYESDEGGNELPHIYLTDRGGRPPRDLTPDLPEGARTAFGGWAEDGRTFLYLCNRRDLRYLDLYEYTLETGESELLWKASGNLSLTLVSRDQKRFILAEIISDVDNNLYLLDRGAEAPVLLTPHEGEINHGPTAFSRDGRTLYYTSDRDAEFTSLYSMDVETRESKRVLSADWDVTGGGFSRGWKYSYTVTNVDGTPDVRLTEVATGKEAALPPLGGPGAYVPIGFSKNDRYMGATLITDTSPVALYIVDLEAGEARKITDVLPESLQDQEMTSAASVRIPTFDDRKVPAFLYRPDGKGPFPALILVHGGPTAQSQRRFNPIVQYMLSKGYVVLVPNVRGSTGYGKTYTRLDNLDLGGGPLRDVVWCKKWLVKEANVDPDRVVVMGGSYGGYMALAAAAFTPGEFAAQVDFFGVSDLKTLVESFPPYWTAYASFIYEKFGDPRNPDHAEYQHDRSPIHFVDRIETPVLVVQGENDPRVRQDQSDRIVAKLRERDVPVHYMIIPGEGHGFSRNENRLAALQFADRFLDRYVFDDASVIVSGD